MNTAVPPVSVLSKSQYARLKNVSAVRVSQWISEGKIEPDALIGDGRHARIDVRKADAYLRKNLDISQRLGNGLSTKIDTPGLVREPVPVALVSPVAADVPAGAAGAAVIPADPIEEQIKREKLEGLQRENRKRAEEEAARSGRYTLSEDAAAASAKVAGHMLSIIEGALPEIAASLAAKFQIQQRDALHLLRTEFRTVRARAAAALKESVIALPATVVDEIEAPPPAPLSPPAAAVVPPTDTDTSGEPVTE